jgi:hypothetical protein
MCTNFNEHSMCIRDLCMTLVGLTLFVSCFPSQCGKGMDIKCLCQELFWQTFVHLNKSSVAKNNISGQIVSIRGGFVEHLSPT